MPYHAASVILNINKGSYPQFAKDFKSYCKEISLENYANILYQENSIDKIYTKEIMLFRFLFMCFIVALGILCLGLFAVSLFLEETKTKEIGIRKVNGATITEILTMLNGSFVKWVAIAFIIACPIAYYAMNRWLENFAYKTELSWWIFALAGLSALFIALLTVSWQSWSAARRNPVEALRSE